MDKEDPEKELVGLLCRKSNELGVLPSKFGFVTKQGWVIRTWKRRWLVLCRSSLLYYKDMNSLTPQGGVSLAGVSLNLREGTLYLVCQLSYTVKKSGMSRLENRTLALRGLTAAQTDEWYFALQNAVKQHLGAEHAVKGAASSPPPVPNRVARHMTVRRLRSPVIAERFMRFKDLLTQPDSAAVSKLNDAFIFRIRSSNMDEHVILRELTLIMTSKASPLFGCLEQYAAKKKRKIELLVGKVANVQADAQLVTGLAAQVKRFCTAFAEVTPAYFGEEQLFFEFYNVDAIAVAVREVLFSHLELFGAVWELCICIFGRRDSLVFAKSQEWADVRLSDLGVKNSKLWIGTERYREALLMLRQLRQQQAGSVSVLCEVLVQTSVKVVECVTAHHASYVQIGADDFLPLFSFLVIRSELPHAVSQSRLMEDFVFPGESIGVAGYFLASFLASVELIEELGPRAEVRSEEEDAGAQRMQSRLTLSPRPSDKHS